MFDENTLIVSYDPQRGEPRGSRKRGARGQPSSIALGDCIDCQLCVQVCPTGIDIRDGLQYECIGCAHCIDACNQVMDKMAYPRGLINYTTSRALDGLKAKGFRPRTFGYGAALVIMTGVLAYAVAARVPFEIDVLRERGALFQARGERIENDYQLKLINKSQRPLTVDLSVESALPIGLGRTPVIEINPGEVLDLPVRLGVERGLASTPVVPVIVNACVAELDVCASEETVFLGPGS